MDVESEEGGGRPALETGDDLKVMDGRAGEVDGGEVAGGGEVEGEVEELV